MRTDLNMRKGKMVVQGCHASLKVFLDRLYIRESYYGEVYNGGPSTLNGEQLLNGNLTEAMEEWINWEEGKEGFTKICVGCIGEEELYKIKKHSEELNIPCALIVDAGKTEFDGVPTPTCIAVGPAEASEVDKITGEYKLL